MFLIVTGTMILQLRMDPCAVHHRFRSFHEGREECWPQGPRRYPHEEARSAQDRPAACRGFCQRPMRTRVEEWRYRLPPPMLPPSRACRGRGLGPCASRRLPGRWPAGCPGIHVIRMKARGGDARYDPGKGEILLRAAEKRIVVVLHDDGGRTT